MAKRDERDEGRRGKVWVLDTDTKGTGARVIPLEQAQPKAEPDTRPVYEAPPRPAAPTPRAPEPRRPRRFRLGDVMTGKVVAEGVDARTALELLAGMRSIVDVTVDVWDQKADRWRRLSHGEKMTLWRFRAGTP